MANQLDNFIPELWSMAVMANIDQRNVGMAVAANTDHEGELRQAGDTVWVRKFGDILVQPYSKNTPITYQDLPSIKEALTVNEAKIVAFKLDDIDRAQADINILDGYAKRAAVAISNTIDTKIFSYYGSAHANNRLSSSGSPYTISASNAYTLIVDANKALDLMSVDDGARWIILTPNYKSFLMKDSTYLIKGSVLGDQILSSAKIGLRPASAREAPNFVGNVSGMDVYFSVNLPSDSGGKYCLFGQGTPISYAAQIPIAGPDALEAIRLESTMATAARGLLLHDGKVFSEDAKRLGSIYVDS